MIVIKRKSAAVNYPFNSLLDLIQDSSNPGSVPLRMVGIKKYIIAPKATINGSEINVSERRINATIYPDHNGNTIVEYRYEIYSITLIIWIVSLFFLVGLICVPLIIISSSVAVSTRINAVNKHAYKALMELNPVDEKKKSDTQIEVYSENTNEKKSKTPPPLKKHESIVEYFVHVNDEQMGPYDLDKMRMLIQFKNIDKTTLVWKEGMNDWDHMENIKELSVELKKI